jgi:hypothetical protein
MLSLRSLAFILCSAIRLSCAAFLRSPLRSKAPINTQEIAAKIATKIATKMAINRAASMSVSCGQVYTFQDSDGNTPARYSPRNAINALIRTLPPTTDENHFEQGRNRQWCPVGQNGKPDSAVRMLAERGSAAYVATAFEEFAVHVDDALRSSLLVKVVHVLRAQEQAVFQPPLQFRQREMSRVRLGCRSNTPSYRAELPDRPGIATPRVGRLIDAHQASCGTPIILPSLKF